MDLKFRSLWKQLQLPEATSKSLEHRNNNVRPNKKAINQAENIMCYNRGT